MKKELRLSGSGGQGLILAGIILAEAAINQGLNAIQSQSYGPEARGGASKAEVIIGDEEIFFPKVRKPNILLALSQKAFNQYIHDLDSKSIIVVDESIQTNDKIEVDMIYKLPILKTASEKIGKSMVANIVALGVLTQLIPELEKQSVLDAILQRVPQGTESLNTTAFEEGIQLIKL